MAPERGDRSLPAGTEGLPRVFLQSLRTLFDILDDRRRGYVHLREIESRWRGAEARELPAGVMEGLRRAAPASGYLTFERFVLGLRAALPGAEPPVESSGGGRRSVEKPASPRCAEERRGKSSGQREPGPSQPRGRGGDAKAAGQSQGDGSHPGAGDARRHQRGRAEHRRHTITNGVDFSMLKHMKELEQEKDFLLQGLELVERTREWYHQHIQFMQERQRLLGKNKTSAPANPSSALSRLGPVVSPASAGSQQAIIMLKEQNRLLTQEVTDKSERITQLEQEKSALIKQLFEARARNNHETSQLDSTFI
ncbi:suppressor APC domain-containing protein 2 isoform X2 [Aquila chrysaetos chrysaetos]|uniref:suppressor APC domain-containing protein 2 isoform X2 n=1 Tax=Aquila chrysaetos chrysaetos TaxID=223781 RepID=UPI001176A52B|nr:suppressor APC domain-containing protein 2 isoform X2 [Aquila chrysaetos chrysaetos]